MKKILLAMYVLTWPVLTLAEDAFNNETKKAVRVSYELFGGYITDLGIDDTSKEIMMNLDFRGERILLPEVITKISKITDKDDVVIKASMKRINISKL